MSRVDPYRNFRFRVEIEGIQQAAFSDVSGVQTTVEQIEYRTGNESTFARKLPGMTKFNNVTLKWGMTDSVDLYNWHQSVVDGKYERKKVAIVVQDETGSDKARFELSEAWPCRYEAGDLTAKGNDVAVETLELAHEGLKRVA